MHYLFNIVTGKQDTAQAVLIRAIQPTIGIDEILQRRNKSKTDKHLCNGPAKVCQALAINKQHYGIDLTGNKIWIDNNTDDFHFYQNKLIATPRIGIDYAEEDALLPWRFLVKI
jgi:DNA-3-methyladenine glycosylase